jgi:signal transduction histidine kinase/ActR/RegA family two-component response regulator
MASRGAYWIDRWLPQSLARRVFFLYALTTLVFVGLALTLFYQYQLKSTLDDAQQSALMLTEVAAQTIAESAVIGDYDTIERTLKKVVSQSPFDAAYFLARGDAVLRARAPEMSSNPAPRWLHDLIKAQLSEINQIINVGGRDYGVLRLTFDAERLSSGFWRLVQSALLLSVLTLFGGMLLIWFPLKRWLGALDMALTVGRRPAPEQAPEVQRLLVGLPLEFRPMVQALNQTASDLRDELQTRERALVALRDVLSDLRRGKTQRIDDSPTNELGELTAAVARLVTEREDGREALERALVAAEAANRVKSEFLANMSHEIRTPMNGVLGTIDLMLDTPLDDRQRQYGTIVKRSAESLITIINEILDFSRIEAGKLAVESLPCDVRQCVREAVATLELRAREKGLPIDIEIDPAVPLMVLSDAVRLRQVLLNLIGNAVKFTQLGRVVVRCEPQAIEPSRDSDADPVLHFTVIDTGIGIAAEKQQSIFDAFSQEDGSITRRYGGTGLGLTISRRLVELMRGRIWVESAVGQGSRFHFTIRAGAVTAPVSTASAQPEGLPAAASATPLEGPQSSAAPLRILVAEDNPTNQTLLRMILERDGHVVVVANHGREAVARYGEGGFDLVLMDMQMPEMDGLDATRAIRTLEAEQGMAAVTILAITANAMQGDRERCLEAGMNDYLSKPVRPVDLKRKILELRSARA